MTFKELVKMIHNIKTESGRSMVISEIERSFDKDKINAKDYELLYDLALMVKVTAETCRYIGREEKIA